MNYSYLLQAQAWVAIASRRFLLMHQSRSTEDALPSLRHPGAALALALALLLGAGFLVGVPAMAQEVATAPGITAININSANAEALASGLKGVGPTRAQEIVRYRESYGPFASVEELTEVQGISKATLEKNRTVIILE